MKVQVLLRAENLPSPPGVILRKNPNAVAVISMVSDFGSVMGIKRRRVGMTEIVPSNSSPLWSTVTIVDLQAASDPRIAIDIFHTTDGAEISTDEHDIRYQGEEHRGLPILKGNAKPLTSAIFSITEILRDTLDGTRVQNIPGTTNGKVIVTIEPNRDNDDDSVFFFQLRGYSLPNLRRKVLDRPDFFYEVCRRIQDSWHPIFRSDVEKRSLSPTWPEGSIDVGSLCNHDLNRDLLFRVFDLEGSMRNEVGSFETTVHGLMGAVSVNGNCDTTRSFSVLKGDKKMGCIIVLSASVISPGNFQQDASLRMESYKTVTTGVRSTIPIQATPVTLVERLPPPCSAVASTFGSSITSFQDYKKLCQINWCVAIDFTESNGDPRLSDSAHYRTPGRLNDYEWTIKVIGETLRGWSLTRDYPVWGFGGCFYGQTQPIFQCGPTPNAKDVDGVLQAYTFSLSSGITLGKRNCSLQKVIQAAAHFSQKQLEFTKSNLGLPSYTVLTILMVGSESDVLAVRDTITSCRDAPLSILILNMPRGGILDNVKWKLYLQSISDASTSNCTLSVDSTHFIAERNAKSLSSTVLQMLQQQLPSFMNFIT